MDMFLLVLAVGSAACVVLVAAMYAVGLLVVNRPPGPGETNDVTILFD